jgi:heme-degrading monooxygenase HmoA
MRASSRPVDGEPLLAVRPYTNMVNYWQVNFDTNRAIVEVFGAAGYPVPAATVIHQQSVQPQAVVKPNSMIALFFEVLPRPGQYQTYLDMAAALRPHLDQSGGCEFIDRFKSRLREGWLLSYQIWRDEASLVRWRTDQTHHQAQTCGRHSVFADYRLRIAQVLRQESPGKPAWQAQRLNSYNDPATRPARFLSVLESDQSELAGDALEYESIYRPGQFVQVTSAGSFAEALDHSEQCQVNDGQLFRLCEIERDYGMFDRAEAPTYYPAIEKL